MKGLFDCGEPVIGSEVEWQPEPFARPRLDLVPPNSVGEHVRGNPEQPGQGGSSPLVFESSASQPGTGKRFRSQVGCRPSDPACEPSMDRLHVAHVQRCEGGRVVLGGSQESRVWKAALGFVAAHTQVSHKRP